MDSHACENQARPERPDATNLDLTALLANGTIRLLSVRWLLSQPAAGFRIERRQDLPDGAFVEPALAVAMLEAGDIIALSYRWLHPDHPDPAGWHMQRVGSFLREHTHWKALLMDYASISQKGPTGERSPEEQIMFKAGLQGMGMVYATPRIAVLQDKGLPNDAQGVRTYAESGWCTLEGAAASLAYRSGGYMHNVDAKHGRVLLELDQALSWSRHAAVMADLLNKNRTHFFGAADREQVVHMYQGLLERIQALGDDMARDNAGTDGWLMDQSTSWRLRRVVLHLLVFSSLDCLNTSFTHSALGCQALTCRSRSRRRSLRL
jgi:hypothetical protein